MAALAVMLFAGCSNLASNNASVEGSDAGDKCVLSISLKDFDKLKPQASINSRTIDPVNKLTVADIATFKIEGTSARNSTLDLTVVTFDASGDSTNSIAVEYDVWYFTLHAYNAAGDELLKGITTVDLKKAVPHIDFTLSTKGGTTNGSLNLTIKGATDAVKSYYAGLYDINTDALKYELADEDLASPADISITKTAVAPGSYIFKFIPYNNTKANATSREDLTPWSDIITIAPGRETSKEITISIMTAPDAPSNFTAYLIDASEDDNDDFYTVHFDWADNSTNEENFVLRIYESDGTEADLDAIQALTPVAVFDKNFFADNNYYVDGTLGMSTTSCEIKLHTGHLYEFTLTAKNRVGESDVCTRTAPASVATGTTAFAAFPVRVNRQKITYNLMGGTYTEDETVSPAVTSTEDIVEYSTYAGTAATVSPVTAPATLIYNNHPWSKWVTQSYGTTEITAAPDYQDLMVYASYDLDVDLHVDIADQYKTLVVTAACTETGATYDATTNTLVLDTTNNPSVKGGKITFTISTTDKAGNALPGSVEKIFVIVDSDSPKIRANAMSYQYPLARFKESKTYYITVAGEINGEYYSADPIPLVVDIQ